MNENWPKARLAEVLKRVKDEINVEDEHTYARLTIRMKGNGIVLRDRVSGFEIGTKRQFVARAGQLVLSKIDARNGAFGILPSEYDKAIITGNFWAFDADKERLLPAYFDYLTKTPLFVEFCVRASEGTTNRLYLQEDQFLAQEIMLPSLSEQRLIVARIEELAAKVEEGRELRRQAVEAVEALCRSMISHDSEIKPTPMRELVKLRLPDVVVRPEGTYQFAGVYCFGRGVFRGDKKTGMDFAYARLTRLHVGNFVYPKLMAWEGALGVVPPECDGCVVSTEFPVFEVFEELVFPEVLDTYFRTPAVWPKIAGASTGTNVRRRRLNPKDFLNYCIPLPSRQTQERLRRVQAQVSTLKRLQAAGAVELAALMPSILDKAFRGEL